MTARHSGSPMQNAGGIEALVEQLKARAQVERVKPHRDFDLIEMLLESAFQLKLFNERRTR